MNRYFGDTTLSEPIVQMFGNEPVIAQVRVGAINPVHLLRLAGAERFPGIKAPGPLQQSLAAEHFVDAGDATCKSVCSVEDGGIGVGSSSMPGMQPANPFAASKMAALASVTST